MSSRRGAWTFVLITTLVGAMVLFAALRLRGPGGARQSPTLLIWDVPSGLEEADPPGSAFSIDWMHSRRVLLPDVVSGLDRAARDPHVAGLVLHIDGIDWGWAKLDEVREALMRFRDADKPVYADLSGGSDPEYYLASAATCVSVPPTSVLQLDGLSESVLFLRGALDKLAISPQFIQAGRYKSATETYSRTGMSPEAREALELLLDDSFEIFVGGIGDGRGLPMDTVRALIDRGPFAASAAWSAGLVDTLLHPSDVDSMALAEVGEDAIDLPFARYLERAPERHFGPKIAVIAASGTMVRGESRFSPDEGWTLGSQTLVDALREARTSSSIRAVVLRIDSPGGEITAADEMWQEVRRCQEVKPVVASFSDVAASGGYYVATGAGLIVAQPGTVTGSIGVYGGKLNVSGLLEKLGVSVESISRGRHAEMLSPFRDFTTEEADYYRTQIQENYETFLSRVTESRGMTRAEADSLAQGRVWSGTRAWSLGLVDTLGGLDVAISLAREEAGIAASKDVTIERLPKARRRLIERMLEDWIATEEEGVASRWIRSMAGPWLAAARIPAGAVLVLLPYRVQIR